MTDQGTAPVAVRPSPTWPDVQPTIPSATVVLRPNHSEDVAQIIAACQDPLIGRFTRIPQPYGAQDAASFLEQSAQGWRDRTAGIYAGVDPQDEDTILLSIGLVRISPADRMAEIGYWTAPQHRRHGYATVAAEALSRVALTQWGFVRIELLTDVANRASQQVAVGAGFRSEGIARCRLFLAGNHHDAVVYSRVRRDLTAATEPVRRAPSPR